MEELPLSGLFLPEVSARNETPAAMGWLLRDQSLHALMAQEQRGIGSWDSEYRMEPLC